MYKDKIKYLINKGISESTASGEALKIRFVNISCIVALLLTPLVFLNNVLIGNDNDYFPMLFFMILCCICFILNTRHKNQFASIVLILGGVLTTYWATYINTIQVSAPYFNIVLSLAAIFLLDKIVLKIVFSFFTLASFFMLNAYQIEYRPFVFVDYIPVAIMLFGLLICAYFYNKEYIRSETLVKNQANTLIQLKNEEHKNSLERKQKDLETIIANNRMQLKIKENILNKLKKVKNIESNIEIIRTIKLELINDINLQKKMQFIESNINEINSVFSEKLNAKHPDLSKKERELCSYIKLKLSTKEIASITNSSVNTIYVTKNRLKAKLLLNDNEQVDSYLINF
jgi:DNA-binding CsgD family transcriptional regulator